MIPSEFPASEFLNFFLTVLTEFPNRDLRDFLGVHPCKRKEDYKDYELGPLPPWLYLLRAYQLLPKSNWCTAMQNMSDSAKKDADNIFLGKWFGCSDSVNAKRALYWARRLLPDHFVSPSATHTNGFKPISVEADALEHWLIEQEVGILDKLEQPQALRMLVLLVGWEGVCCELVLQPIRLPPEHANAHGLLVRAPGAALLELESDFEAGLRQVQHVIRRVLAPAGTRLPNGDLSTPVAISWRLRALDKKDDLGNEVAALVKALEGPSLTAPCAVGCLHLLRDHLAEPWRNKWWKVLREIKIERFCATAALTGYDDANPTSPTAQKDVFDWPLAVVGKVGIKLDAVGKLRDNWWSHKLVFVANHQVVTGNVVLWEEKESLADLIEAAHAASEPLRLPKAFEALEEALTSGDESKKIPIELIQAVHDEPVGKWLTAGETPAEVDAEKVLRVWWLKRYAHWASGRYQTFGPVRDGRSDEPVALTRHFHPIAIAPALKPKDVDGHTKQEVQDHQHLPSVDNLTELFEKCPEESAFRLHAAPAGGKTTLLAHYELDAAFKALLKHRKIGKFGELAMWLPMRDYSAHSINDSLSAVEGLWARVTALYPDLAQVLLAWHDGRLKLPGLQLRWLCDAVNEIRATDENQRQAAQGDLYRGLTDQVRANGCWLPPIFTVRTHSQNQALDGARGCTLLTWDEPSRLRYMETRLGPESDAFKVLKQAIDADPRSDHDKFFATPGHLAVQCTLMRAGIVSEPAKDRAQLFCTLLWLRLSREREVNKWPNEWFHRDELIKLNDLKTALSKPDGWRWPKRQGQLMQAMSSLAVWQQHLDPASRELQRQSKSQERVWSMSAFVESMEEPSYPALQGHRPCMGVDKLIEVAQHLNLWQYDSDKQQITWTHQLWLELFAAIGLALYDDQGPWLDAQPPELPEMKELLDKHLAAGKQRYWFPIPSVPPIAEEETLRYLVQLRGDAKTVVKRVLNAGNAPLAARLALDNWSAFGEPVYPDEDPQGPWRPPRKDKTDGGTDPDLNELRSALHVRMFSTDVHIAQRIEAGDLLGRLGGSPLYEICGQALVLKDEYWMQVGEPGTNYKFEMGDLDFLSDEDNLRHGMGLHMVEVAPFHMAAFKVTVAQYLCFLVSEEYTDLAWWPKESGQWFMEAEIDELLPYKFKGNAWTDPFDGLEPVSCNFWHAQAYTLWERQQRAKCKKDVLRVIGIPTEVQWEGAARYHAHRLGKRWHFAHTEGKILVHGVSIYEALFDDVNQWDINSMGNHYKSPVGVFVDSNAGEGMHALRDMAGHQGDWTRSRLDRQFCAPDASGDDYRMICGNGHYVGERWSERLEGHENNSSNIRLVWVEGEQVLPDQVS